VIAFAANHAREERNFAGESKRLREAVAALEARTIDAEIASQLFATLQTELRLQAGQAGS
jgi:hypothetical protein